MIQTQKYMKEGKNNKKENKMKGKNKLAKKYSSQSYEIVILEIACFA